MKKNLQVILSLFLFCCCFQLNAQFNLAWAKKVGGTNSEKVQATAIDANSNVISTGYFQGTVDFDPGAGTFNMTSAGKDDIFVLKLDKNGNFIWARRMGSSAFDRGLGIAIDANDDVFVTGYFQGTCNFDPTSSNTSSVSAGLEDAFICKIDNSGAFQWVHQMGGTDPDFAYGIAVDGNNDVAAVGSFEGKCDFDYPNGSSITANAKKDAYICKVDGSGTFQWAREVQSPENEEAYGISTDSGGDWYVTGYFEDNCFFDPTAANINLKSAGLQDIFVFRSDNSSGKFVWAIQMGLADPDLGYGIALDVNDEVYVTGSFEVKCDFDPTNTNFALTSNGLKDAFLCKMDNSGNFQWAKNMGGTGNDIGYSVDGPSDINVTGSFEGTCDFNPSGTAFKLTSAGLKDIFISQFDAASGKHLISAAMGGTGDDEGYTITNDAPAVYIGGYFNSTADFDPTAGTSNLVSAGAEDAFVAKYAACQPATMTSISPSSNPMCVGKTGTLTVNGILNTATGWQLFSGSCGGTLLGTYTSNSFTVSPASTITYYVRPTGGCATYTGCVSVNITVNSTPAVTVTSSASASICAGTSVTLTASGATTYSWNPGSLSGATVVVTPTSNVTYTATGITAGCPGLTTKVVTVTALPTITLTSVPSVACAGQSPTITVTGGLTNYTWSTGATTSSIVVSPTTATTYSITGNNTVCSNSKSIFINTSANPTITAVTNLSVICVGQSATLTANGAGTYTWNTGSNSSVIAVTPTITTSYTVTGANGFGCQSAPVVVTQSVSTCLGIDNLTSSNNQVMIYPNPNNGSFTIYMADIHNNPTLVLFDVMGRQILTQLISENQTNITIYDVTAGIYTYKITNNQGDVKHGKFIKE